MADDKNPLADLIGKSLAKAEESRSKDTTPKERPAPSRGRQPQPVRNQDSGYRFLNPYNFVRSLDAPKMPDAASRLLGRCPPPPHDRYVGLTGKIVCSLENVTPLFISDSHATARDKEVEAHHVYRFFQVENESGELEPALLASSLRGMLRNVFEAVTNSCYAHFDYEKRLSYHLPTQDALKLIPARVEKDTDGRWRLRLLPGTAQVSVGERPRVKLYPGRVERYQALSPGRRRKDGRPSEPRFNRVDPGSLQHGDFCYALAEDLSFPPVWNVLRVSDNKAELDRQCQKGQKVFEGYLCLNNQNIETKRFERFFFDDSRSPTYVPLPEDVRVKYEELIKDYRERHAKTIEQWRNDRGWAPEKIHIEYDNRNRPERKHAAFSRFIIGDPRRFEISEGELVYAMLVGSPSAPSVQFIVPVAVPRVGYERKIAQLLPDHLWKCEDYEQLCPACRTFGWVYGRTQEQPELPAEKVTAYAGRLQFGQGRLAAPLGEEDAFTVTLDILSSPKPTTSRFYLKPRDGKPQSGQSDYQVSYDNRDNTLRGRKVYRHFGHSGDKDYWEGEEREYHAVPNRKGQTKSDQNRTAKGVLKPGARFTFEIAFENLAEVELGALLWTLELEGQQFHRLGFAKPLGFGSVKIQVEQMAVYDFAARYASADQSGEVQLPPDRRQALVSKFKAAMQSAYPRQPFNELPHVKDILALLGEPDPDLPIHYPRTDEQPVPDGKNFEWFMGNNRNKDARYALDLPGEEDGLPLIDRYGNVKK